MNDLQIQLGSIRDEHDDRDRVRRFNTENLPSNVDLSVGCLPAKHQGRTNSCTAHAGVALVEYFVKRHYGKTLEASRLFLYKVARNLDHKQPDTGTSSRTTMKALAIFGVPPEDYWPFDETKLYEEPSAFCYALAQQYQAEEYYRIDKEISKEDLLLQIKSNLAQGIPIMFSFLPYKSCLNQGRKTGEIPFPGQLDPLPELGHTVVAVGYDDNILIKNTDPPGLETQGAIKIRNSWGEEWGQKGHGWLPYEYVLQPCTHDWWTLWRQEWFDGEPFEGKTLVD